MKKKILYQLKREFAERAIGHALGLLGSNPERNAKYINAAIAQIAKGEKQAQIRNWISNWLEGEGGRGFLMRVAKLHPNVRRRFVARLIVSGFFRDPEVDRANLEENGITPPYTILISPTMRCNYRCQGCYASDYERDSDMKPETFDRILTEGEALGINIFTILGGEPFLYHPLLDIIEKHNKSCFQIFTNGHFINGVVARRLVELGNVSPQISVNGPGEYTDATRVKGAYVKAMQAMDNLREAGCIFGFSTVVTPYNVDAICSEEWIDLLIQKGALYGWHFLYMPVGKDPDIKLMPTPEQRNKLRIAINHFRRTKPILLVDFWSDGPLEGGCIARRIYFHINHHGDVEPCIFCHFATHNINEHSLVEVLKSPFLTAIMEKQPFNHNTLRPCPMIDNPPAMWEIIQKYGARPTHPDAVKMFTTYMEEMKKYAQGVAEVMDEVWENEGYSNWAPKWALSCKIPAQRLNKRHQEYEMARQKELTFIAEKSPSERQRVKGE